MEDGVEMGSEMADPSFRPSFVAQSELIHSTSSRKFHPIHRFRGPRFAGLQT